MKQSMTIALLLLTVVASAQIPINTNFQVSTPNPIDGRMTIATLSDTSTITDLYDGLLTVVQDIDEIWQYDGSSWVDNSLKPSNLAQEGATLGQVPRWDGSQYTPQSIETFEFVDTSFQVTVCNNADSCDFTSLNQAFEFVTEYKTKHDSTSESNIVVRIRNNPDGSKARLKGLGVFNVDLSNVTLTTAGDTVVVDSVVNQAGIAGGKIMLAFFDCGVPAIDDFVAIDSTGQAGTFPSLQLNGIYVTRASNVVKITNTNFIGNFASAFRIDRSRFELINLGADTVNHILRAEVSSGFAMGMRFDTSASTLGAIRAIRGSNIDIDIESGAWRHLATLQGSSLSFWGLPQAASRSDFIGQGMVSLTNSNFWDSSIRINAVDNGILFLNESSPAPFQEFTTAQLPSPTSGPRYVYNLDTETTLVIEDGQYQPLDKPDTLVVHLPVLEYTGNTNDTIPNLFETYLTANPRAWGNRKVTAIEVTTPDTTSVDLHFWVYEYNAVDATSSLFLPDPGASEAYFTLPAGQTNRRFEVGDSFFPSTAVDISDSKMLDFRLLNGNGSPGIDSLVGEDPNGIYLTLYLIE